MKKNILLTAAIVFLNANNTMASNQSFCKEQKKQVELSKKAILNKGKISQNEYFRGCRHDIQWMQQTREVLCEDKGLIQDIEVPKHIFFVFDGAADFSASGGEKILDIANLDGSEGDDLNRGNMNGGSFFLKELRDQTVIPMEEMQIHYHSSSGFHNRENYNSATGCMRQMDLYLDKLTSLNKSVKRPIFTTMGYSNGGVNAIKFQNFLANTIKHPADLVFTLDPIAKTIGFLFVQNSKFRGKKHELTKRFVNLYQNVDHGSLGNLKLRGKPVKDADVNIHVTHENSPMAIYPDGNIAHLTLNRAHIVRNTFRCEIAKISKSEYNLSNVCLPNPFKPSYHEDNN